MPIETQLNPYGYANAGLFDPGLEPDYPMAQPAGAERPVFMFDPLNAAPAPETIEPAKKKFLQTPGGMAAATVLPSIAQFALAAAPTAASRDTNQQLRVLEAKRQANQLGLTGADRTLAEQAYFAPVRAAAAQAQAQGEAIQASMGTTSPAALRQQQADTARRVDEALRAGGVKLFEQHLKKVDADLLKLEQLKAAKAKRQEQARGALAAAIGEIGPLAGQIRSAQADPSVDTMGMTPEQVKAARTVSILQILGLM